MDLLRPSGPAAYQVGLVSGHDNLANGDEEQAAVLVLTLDGSWTGTQPVPSASDILPSCEQQAPKTTCWRVMPGSGFEWDSRAMVPLLEVARHCDDAGIKLDVSALPVGMQRLLRLATAVKPAAAQAPHAPGPMAALRIHFLKLVNGIHDVVGFVGALTLALGRFLTGRSHTRMRDLVYFFEQCGPQAIAIVALVSVLVGMILAYLGSVQLRQFGVEVYVANLVTLGMVREMGPLMTAVIMAGRTGAAYAAQLGAMQSNEEIDAITTLGLSPMEYLVIPRFLALVMVMPLLTVFANVVGVLGGALVATTMDVSLTMFMAQAREAVTMGDVFSGLFKSVVFAGLIAIAGCQSGIQSGRSSSAVGQATTRAVVHGIVYLVVADTALNVLYDELGI